MNKIINNSMENNNKCLVNGEDECEFECIGDDWCDELPGEKPCDCCSFFGKCGYCGKCV